jgi:hypothetical protein
MKEKGSLIIISIAFIYSITSNLGKIATLHSTPFFFGMFYSLELTMVLAPVAFFRVMKTPLISSHS